MDASWSALGGSAVASFLSAANLDSLPEASAMTDAQWKILEGIVGETSVNRFKASIGISHNASSPSLPLPKRTDFSDIVAKMSEMDLELNTIMEQFMTASIGTNKDKIKEKTDERMKQLEEARKKLVDAENAKAEPWWKRLLKWIVAAVAAIVGVIVGIVSAPVTGGLGTAAAVLAVAAFVMFVLRDTGVMDMLETALAEHMQTKYGWSPEKSQLFAKIFGMGLELGVAIASVAVNVANAAKMASAAKNLIDGASKIKGAVDTVTKTVSLTAAGSSVAREASQASLKAMDILLKLETVKRLYTLSVLATSGLQIYNGAVEVYAGVKTGEAREHEAIAAELKAFIQRLQGMLEEDSDRLKDIIEKINSMLNGFSDIIDEIGESHRSVIQHLNA